MIQNFRKRYSIPLALISCLSIASCGNEEMYPVAVGGGAAASRAVPQAKPQPQPQQKPLVSPVHGSYTHDPDRDEWAEEEEPVVASSLEDAREKCRKLESKWGLPLDEVKIPSRKNGKLFRCIFRGYRPQ